MINSKNVDSNKLEKLQTILKTAKLKDELKMIVQNYEILSKVIKCCTEQYFCIEDAYWLQNNINFGTDPLEVRKYMKKRYNQNEIQSIVENKKRLYTQEEIEQIKKCPATTIIVERSFSVLNKLLAKDRIFAKDNIAKYLKAKINKF